MDYQEMTFREILDYSRVVMEDKSSFVPTHIFLHEFGIEEEVELRKTVRIRGSKYDSELVCVFRFRVGKSFGSGVRRKEEFDRRSRQIRDPETDVGVAITFVNGQAEFVFLGGKEG